MKKKCSMLLVASLFALASIPSMANAGNVKKTYINIAKEGTQATASDLGTMATYYGQINGKLTTMAYEPAGGVHGVTAATQQVVGPAGNFAQALSVNEQNNTNASLKVYPVPTSGPHAFPSNQFTMEMWVKPYYKSGEPHFLSFASNGGDNSLILKYNANMNVSVYIANSYSVFTPVLLEQGKWNHLAVTWSSATGAFKVYKNGNATPVYSTTLAKGAVINTTNGSFMLGQEQDCVGGCVDPTQIYTGSYDEVRIWNVERTGQQIADNFNKPLSTLESGLSLYYPFD